MGVNHYAAIVLSAGSGRRMNSAVPKQYLELCGHPVLYYSLKAFEESPVDEIILVAGAGDIDFCRSEIVERYRISKVTAIVEGGSERYLSVYEGLKAARGADYVLIHDGARPLVSRQHIVDSMRGVEQEKACVLAIPVKDTIKVADEKGYAVDTPERSTLWAVQTPQTFERALLSRAYEELWRQAEQGKGIPPITDDAMLVEHYTEHKVKLIRGSYQNIKITTAEDMSVAAAFISKIKNKY